LRSQLDELTAQHEASRPTPWQVADAPQEYIAKNMAAIVGIELVITRLLGKWKVSQNQPAQNQAGVIAGLRTIATSSAQDMANWVAERKKTDNNP